MVFIKYVRRYISLTVGVYLQLLRKMNSSGSGNRTMRRFLLRLREKLGIKLQNREKLRIKLQDREKLGIQIQDREN